MKPYGEGGHPRSKYMYAHSAAAMTKYRFQLETGSIEGSRIFFQNSVKIYMLLVVTSVK